MVIIREIKN